MLECEDEISILGLESLGDIRIIKLMEFDVKSSNTFHFVDFANEYLVLIILLFFGMQLESLDV